MTREEAIQHFKEQLDIFGGEHAEAIKVAIEALKQVTGKLNNPDDSFLTADSEACKEQKSKLDLISRQAATSIPILPKEQRKVFKSEDDAFETGWNEALACVNMLPSADRPKDGDLISRAEAIEALGEEPLVWCDEEYEIAERNQWKDDVEAIKSVPSADRPKGEWIHTPNGIDRDFVWWVCSECGHKIFSETEKDRIEFHAYCGRCGADMRGEEE